MRIGITCHPTFGGSGVIATELGHALAARGHEVHFVTYSMPIRLRPFQDRVYYHEVEVSAYPLFKYPPYDIALASRMAEVIQTADLDLFHVHYAIPHSICAILGRQLLPGDWKTKIVTTLHGTDITLVGMERSYYNITKFGIEESDGVTAVSDYLKRQTKELFKTAKAIEVIPNFVNTEFFKPRDDKKLKSLFIPKERKALVHVSNFRPVKRIGDVLRCFALVAGEVDCDLLMVGEGPDRRMAEELAHELGVAKRVHFFGNVEGVADILSIADAMLLPSEYETFGLAALEAMSCGTAVFASNSGGLPELIEDGKDGFLCNVGDPLGMAEKVIRFLRDGEKIGEIGKNAREKAVTRFSEENIIPHYEEYYRTLLS